MPAELDREDRPQHPKIDPATGDGPLLPRETLTLEKSLMNVHEYQGKEILRGYGVATPRGIPCFSVAKPNEAARKLGGKVWVVKAQIHAGGRARAEA